MHSGHHKVSSTQHLTSTYPSAYDTSPLVMPSQTSSDKHVVSSHGNPSTIMDAIEGKYS